MSKNFVSCYWIAKQLTFEWPALLLEIACGLKLACVSMAMILMRQQHLLRRHYCGQLVQRVCVILMFANYDMVIMIYTVLINILFVLKFEASIDDFLGKRRRANADFPGADVILKQIAEKPTKKRIGLLSSGPPARGKIVGILLTIISLC